MNKVLPLILLLVICQPSFSQRILMSWSQQNIENYTREMYDAAQKLTSTELLSKNLNVDSWSEVFVTLNASKNHHAKDPVYLQGLANQIINREEIRLKGTSRLIIWDRIISGDIIFEGKGLVIDNDLFTIAGRANQILQTLTDKNFGYITIKTTEKELEALKTKWLDFLGNKPVEEYKPAEFPNAKIAELSSMTAVQALIISLQDNPTKSQITKNCLKKIYNLEELPTDKSAQANFCNPDRYTFSYLGMLFGHEKLDETKDAKWWQNFWETNHAQLAWNSEKGIYQLKK